MAKTLTREAIDTIITRALDRLTEDEREEMMFESFIDKYNYEEDLLTYITDTEVLDKYAALLDVDVNDLTTFLNPYNVVDYDDDLEKLY